jgi:hypothetical protein
MILMNFFRCTADYQRQGVSAEDIWDVEGQSPLGGVKDALERRGLLTLLADEFPLRLAPRLRAQGQGETRMRLPIPIPKRAWLLIPVCCVVFMGWVDHVRLHHVKFVSNVAKDEARVDARSPTGYADGKRWLIVPEHNNPTYQWIEETQLMAAKGDWRVRSVDYENAPYGREVHSASPYRWWLVLLAWLDRCISGRPFGLSLEHSALFADPLLQLFLLIASAIFVARRFGAFAAALMCVGLAVLFPFGAALLPGIANDFGLAQICALWSVLLVVAGAVAQRRMRALFIAGGCAGGAGLWLSAAGQTPVIVGIAIGAVIAALVAGRATGAPTPGPDVPPWRAWAVGGALSSFAAYLVEYFPSHMEPQFRVNYPLYSLAWLGLGEILWRFASWVRHRGPLGGVRGVSIWVLSAAAVASLPVALIKSGNGEFLAGDLLSTRLTNLPDGTVASSVSEWITRDGASGALAATLLPLLLLGPAAWLLARTRTGRDHRTSIAIALGPLIAVGALAVHEIRLWNTFDCAALVLLVATAAAAAAQPGALRWVVAASLAPAMLAGLIQILPTVDPTNPNDFKFTTAEIEGLYERAVAQWIADRAGPGGATVLVPPFRTSSFCFYGGVRGLGTQNWENRDGLSATFRIVNSTRPDETLALINQRGVTHIVVPSWDTDLDDFARMGLKQPMDSFIYALHQTDGGIFPWLRALPYSIPEIPGFKEPSVLVLEVTDETDPATLRSRLVEYLIEMHRIDQAAFASRALLRYPADLGALVALAQVAKARGNEEDFARAFSSIESNLASGSDRALAWDRRVSLAVVLALGGRTDLSEAQVKRCVAHMDDAHIRLLTTGSLYHLLVLCKHYGVDIPDPNLRALALKLLPEELRERL